MYCGTCCMNGAVCYNSCYLLCLFNCSGCVEGEHYIIKSVQCSRIQQICSAVTGWVQTEAKTLPNPMESFVCIKILQHFKLLPQTWKRCKLLECKYDFSFYINTLLNFVQYIIKQVHLKFLSYIAIIDLPAETKGNDGLKWTIIVQLRS